MNVLTCPNNYRSAFREACFTVDGLTPTSPATTVTPASTDIAVMSLSAAETTAEPTAENQVGDNPTSSETLLGTKRIYPSGESEKVYVNVAPYVRRLLSPQPLRAHPSGLHSDPGRTVECRISSGGDTSQSVWLTAGTDDAPPNTILSAAPCTAKIAPGQRDEISVVAPDASIRPVLTFHHNGAGYTDESLPAASGKGMWTMVVDADAVAERFAALTGAAADEMTGFTVWLLIASPEDTGTQADTASGSTSPSDTIVEDPTSADTASINTSPADIRLSRRYEVDRTSGTTPASRNTGNTMNTMNTMSAVNTRNAGTAGAARTGTPGSPDTSRRLAWVNRYGAIDYCTFPCVAGGRIEGRRGTIYTSDGYRTVATASETTETLLSAPCDAATVGWLSEIFSSPSVWIVNGTEYTRVEVAGGSAEYSPAYPGVVSLTVGPAERAVSRRS